MSHVDAPDRPLRAARAWSPDDPSPWQVAHVWNGSTHEQPDGRRVERVDPTDDQPLGEVPAGGLREVTAALRSARRSGPAWAATSAEERAALVRRAARRLAGSVERIARRNCHEMGKPLSDAVGGVEAAVGTALQYAELGPLHRGRTLQGDAGAIDTMRRVPRGTIAAIVPWNDPVAIAVQGVAAALVTGNTVVVKPSERAPFSVAAALECFDHLPPGVLGVVHGDAHTGRLLAEGDVDVVMLTGSVAAGRQVAVAAAHRGAHTVLELGGNDALVVDAGVDPVWAARQAATGSFANAGQICVAVERVYVHRSIAAEFVEALVTEARRWQQGDPLDDGTQIGPLVDRAHREQVHRHVTDALGRGARALTGAQIATGPGAFYPPTVLVDVPQTAMVLRDETFGPVAPVVVVDSFDEALDHAARGDHGLSATVLTRDTAHALRATEQLDVGTVKINSVFGGAPGGAAHPRGSSGNALGYGPELLDELTNVKVMHLEPAP